MSGFFKKLFNRVIGRKESEAPAPEAEATPEALPEPATQVPEPEPAPEPEPELKAEPEQVPEPEPEPEPEVKAAPKPAVKKKAAPQAKEKAQPETPPVAPPRAEKPSPPPAKAEAKAKAPPAARPKPAAKERPAPQPKPAPATAPEPVKPKAPPPEPVKAKASPPEPVKEGAPPPEPQPVKAEAPPPPAPAKAEAPLPEPVKEEAPPQGIEEPSTPIETGTGSALPFGIQAEPLPLAHIKTAEETAPPPPPVTDEEPTPKGGWFARLRQGLAKSSRTLTGGITDIFTKRKLDAATLEDLEDLLIQGDLGIDMAGRITNAVAKGRYDKMIDPGEVRRILAAEVEKVLKPVEVPFTFDETQKPFVILVVGVNGSGKTTTIGKLGAIAVDEGYSVLLAACDTFRAAAIEQLTVWGERIGAQVVSRPTGADASGLAFDALAEARRAGTDIVFIDTAGRLHNKTELMAELEKIVRVIKKQDPTAPHAVLLVLDATTGQNAIAQADVFTRIAGVTGLVMTKLDGTARGGILVAIAERFKLPVHAIGVGETVDDLQPFDATAFARAIAGLDEEVDA